MAGHWTGRTRTWLGADETPLEADVYGTIQLVLEGRFALYLYQTSLDDEPVHGMFMFGFNTTLALFEASWIDSYHNHTAIMSCTGGALPDGFSVRGGYPDAAGGPDWEWRTDVTLPEADRLTLTAYNISPEGTETKAVETILRRAAARTT